MSLTIELDEQTAAVVQELAAREQRSASEVIQDAVAAYRAKGKRPMPTGMGKYHSGHTDTASRAREIIREAVEKGEWP